MKLMLPLLLAGMALTGCARTSGTEAVSVTAINYTDQELNGFLFEQPDDENKVAGGVPVRPFEGAGMMCCFSVPAKWRPAIKVKLTYDWWQGDDKPRKYETKEIELPPYPDGQAGMLWALFYSDGSVQVVSSNYAPGHAKWPGKIKGGPVPTLEYRRKMWQLDYDQAKDTASLFFRMATNPTEQDLRKSWDSRNRDDPRSTHVFNGPDDPKFIAWVKQDFLNVYQEQAVVLKNLEARKP